MELKVNETQLPQPITFNYEELKTAIAEKAELYAHVVYTDDTIKEAKSDKASLNKLKKALNDERIRREKEYMKPFNVFKDQVNELIAIIDKPVSVIDSQIKEYQDRLKTEKRNEVIKLVNSYPFPPQVDIELLWNSKWLNASFSMNQVKAELEQKLEDIKNDLEMVDKLEKFSFEARERYFQTLDLRTALDTANRLAESERRKAEYEAERQRRAEAEILTADEPKPAKRPTDSIVTENSAETKITAKWVSFRAYLTIPQARELKAFCDEHGIELKAIREA